MKHIKAILCICILALLLGWAAAQEIYFQPESVSAPVGTSFTLNLMARDVIDLSAVEFRISYHADVLEALEINRGALLDVPDYFWHPGEIDNEVGSIGFTSAAIITDSIPGRIAIDSNGGVLAAVTFRNKAFGISPVQVADTFLCSIDGAEIVMEVSDATFSSMSIEAGGRSPIPAQ